MAASAKRASPRNNYEAPILHANFNTEDYYSAKMYNCSMTGMYFESGNCPQPNSNICIKMVNYLPDTDGPEAYRFYRAKVRWCKEIGEGKIFRYGIGVQYIVKSHDVCGPTYTCSLCGENIPYGKIHEIDDFVYLCSDCFKHYENLPEEKIKESIERFMIGNVL